MSRKMESLGGILVYRCEIAWRVCTKNCCPTKAEAATCCLQTQLAGATPLLSLSAGGAGVSRLGGSVPAPSTAQQDLKAAWITAGKNAFGPATSVSILQKIPVDLVLTRASWLDTPVPGAPQPSRLLLEFRGSEGSSRFQALKEAYPANWQEKLYENLLAGLQASATAAAVYTKERGEEGHLVPAVKTILTSVKVYEWDALDQHPGAVTTLL